MRDFLGDVRFAVRTLRRQPALTFTVAITFGETRYRAGAEVSIVRSSRST